MNGRLTAYWHRWRFQLSGFLLLLSLWYIYSALNPKFPAALPEQAIGPFTATPMPANDDAPYAHDGIFVKDFYIRLCDGCMDKIRTGYVNIGPQPLNVSDSINGILHGSRHFQEAHAVAPQQVGPDDKLWIRLQEWNGAIHQAAWELP
jgi:hypothetical protein